MSTILDESGGVRFATLTVDQYDAMIREGILPEGAPIELIDGLLVYRDRSAVGGDPMTVGTRHPLVLKKLSRLSAAFEKFGCHLALQAPIRIPPSHEPEPDACIVRGRAEDYSDSHPEPKDVVTVVEVSESSLVRDQTTKLRVYAEAGIKQYVIINLVYRQVEMYDSPKKGKYTGNAIRTGNMTVALGGTGRYVNVKAKDLLP